MGGLTKKVT